MMCGGSSPCASRPKSETSRGTTQSVVGQAMVEFYNEAQLDVLRHVHELLSQDDTAGE